MANTKSAKKAWRKSLRRVTINKARRSDMRTHLKKARVAIEGVAAGSVDFDRAQEAARLAESKMSRKASSNTVISRKAAARKTSRLMRRLKSVDPSYQAWKASRMETQVRI